MYSLKTKFPPSLHSLREELERKGVKKNRNSKISSKGKGNNMEEGHDRVAERQGYIKDFTRCGEQRRDSLSQKESST